MLRSLLSTLTQRARCNPVLSAHQGIGTTSYITPSLLSSCLRPSSSSVGLGSMRSFASDNSGTGHGATGSLIPRRPRGSVRRRTPSSGGPRKGGTSTGRIGGRGDNRRGRTSSMGSQSGGRALDSRAQRELSQKRKAITAKEARLQRTAPYRQRDPRSGSSSSGSSSIQQHRPPAMTIAAPEALPPAVTRVDETTGQATEVLGVGLEQLGKPSALEVLAPHDRRTRQQRQLLSPEEYNDLRNRPVRPIRHVPLPQVSGDEKGIDASDAAPSAPGQVTQGDNSIMHRLTQQYGKEKATWMARKIALKRKGITQWRPRNKISRPEMNMLRQLFEQDSEKYSVPVLAERFSISGEAVRRILKSKWQPGAQREDEMMNRHDAEKMIKKMVRQEGFKLRRHPKPGESIEEFHETRKLAFEQLEAQIRASAALATAKENQFRKYTKTGNKASLHGERPGRGGGGVTKWWGTVDDLVPHKRDGHFHTLVCS
eukprot:TRINITY_DN626_c0_g1_i3.p1 TRINITY_DN626_c0_g1~~TRINITY_DN626_c0_g1_i3.p1  ORF type:complete len:484 (-),score=50.92 TRINITY_DN626_c0_g1_i3:550-2001(-)